MVALMPPQTVLTPAGAANALQTTGLDVFGLTVPNLSPVWAGAAPGIYDPTALSLQVTGLRAPFRAIRTFEANPNLFSGPDGHALVGPAAVLRLHPEAARRLEKLVEGRLGATPAIHPVPVALVVRGITMATPVPVPGWFFAGDAVDVPAGPVVLSFHDRRGLPICPIAVAALFADLLATLPALYVANGPAQAVGDPGGLTAILALATGTLVHVIDPHGWGYAPTRDIARLRLVTGAAGVAIPDAAVVSWPAGSTVGRTAADDVADTGRPLRWGFATTGVMARTPLSPPALPAGVALTRQFFRVIAVDLEWHLRGNRGAAPLAGIPADDGTTPTFLLPQVRDPVPNFAFLPDAQSVLGAAAAMTAAFGQPPGSAVFAIVSSPALDDTVLAPPQPGPAGHWPAFPPGAPPQAISAATNPRLGLAAARRAAADGPAADVDVILTIAAGTVPDGAHVRVFPRLFQEILAISDTPSFIRPDGGAALAALGVPTKILLVNAFGLAAGAAFPNPAALAVDIVVTDRFGRRRLFSETTIVVGAGPENFTPNPAAFGGAPLLGAPLLSATLTALRTRAIAASPVFGVPRTGPLPAPGGSAVAFIRALANETQPRQGPRLPTMMRFDTVLATGAAASAGTPLAWQALLTGARLTLEARSYRPDLGNPGNPPGSDIHAVGVRCDGMLAADLAMHAIKRAQPIVPLGAGTFGWVGATGGKNWNPGPPDTSGTVAAVMLETVAAVCDSPELSVLPDPAPGDNVQALVDAATAALGAPTVPVTIGNEAAIRPRVQREIVTSKHGQRDALWSLRRALGQARELIYIESPAFARTARPTGPPAPHEIDLVDTIRAQLVANPRLKVIVCTPRVPDFDATKQGWVWTAYAHRKQAVLDLTAAALARVAVFHPIGFPGRTSPLRTTTVIVDDAWCLTGTSHFRRRGMTFDGAADIASLDRQIRSGYSAAIARFRQVLMAARLGVDVPLSPTAATALWVRLAEPESAFTAVSTLLDEGGQGHLTAVWAGPAGAFVQPVGDDVGDPDGASGASFLTFIAAALAGE